jgi:hypothetical protein
MKKAIQKFGRLGLIYASLVSFTSAHGAGDHQTDGIARVPIQDYRGLTPDETTIQTTLDTYGRAMEEKSLEIMAQVVIPEDFSTIESGYPNWSWDDFRDNHLLVEMDSFTDIQYSLSLIASELDQSLGFAIYKYTATGNMQGKSLSITGLGTAILERSSNKTSPVWRIHHLHTSAPRGQLEAMDGEQRK